MQSNPFAAPSDEIVTGSSMVRLAPYSSRFIGAMIDSLLSIGALCLGFPIMAMDPNISEFGAELGTLGHAGTAVSLIALFTLTCLQWYWITTLGQSVGKRVMKTQIRKINERPVDFVSGVIMRSWIIGFAFGFVQLFTCGLLGWVVYLVDAIAIFGSERRCLHDLIAGTKVVELEV